MSKITGINTTVMEAQKCPTKNNKRNKKESLVRRSHRHLWYPDGRASELFQRSIFGSTYSYL